jgi:hypothetical protein
VSPGLGLVMLVAVAAQAEVPPTEIGPSQQPAVGSPSDDQGATVDPSSRNDAAAWALSIIDRIRSATRRVKSTECTFYKEEWKGGGDLAPAQAQLKHRASGDTYLRFDSGPLAGRHILYRPKKNDGKLIVSNPMFNLNLDPKGFLAMRDSRHSVDEAGLLAICGTILGDARKLKKLPPAAVTYKKLGGRTIAGEKTKCFRSVFDKKRHPQLFAAKTEICVSDKTGLPVEVKVWQHEGGKLRRVGLYRYTKCRINTLTDQDFDPKNKAYRF